MNQEHSVTVLVYRGRLRADRPREADLRPCCGVGVVRRDDLAGQLLEEAPRRQMGPGVPRCLAGGDARQHVVLRPLAQIREGLAVELGRGLVAAAQAKPVGVAVVRHVLIAVAVARAVVQARIDPGGERYSIGQWSIVLRKDPGADGLNRSRLLKRRRSGSGAPASERFPNRSSSVVRMVPPTALYFLRAGSNIGPPARCAGSCHPAGHR